jgi:hypothetical protein
VTTDLVVDLSATRLQVARVLMGLAAASALAAAVGAIPAVTDPDPTVLMVETWRLFGFVTFACLFALLSWRPLGFPWLWEIVILNKLLLTVTAGGYATGTVGPGDVEGAAATFGWDGGLTALLVVAYVACRGWQARTDRRPLA